MDKTLHKKLTEKHLYNAHTVAYARGNDMSSGAIQEMDILRQAAKELLQPRPEAIANILKLASAL